MEIESIFMALRQACLISDQVTTVTPARGLAPYIGVSVTATPSAAPPVFELLADGVTWVPLYPLPIKTQTDANGVWSISLPSQSYSDPNTVTWIITLPDNSQWGGPVTDAMVTASLVTPLTVHDLSTTWGWGRVVNSTAPAPVIVTGPVGPAGPNPAYDTLANRPVSGVDRQVYVATDQTKALYQYQRGAWVAVAPGYSDSRLSDARAPLSHESSHLPGGSDALDWFGSIHRTGTHAARPVAGVLNAGTIYVETDTGLAWLSTGSVWVEFATIAAATPSTPGVGRLPWFNPRDAAYGAVWDGVNDDTAAVQAAIAAAQAVGGSVRCSSGTALVGQLSITQAIDFVGAGLGRTTLKAKSGLSGAPLLAATLSTGSKNLVLLGFTVDLTGSGSSDTTRSLIGVQAYNCDHSEFRNIRVKYGSTGLELGNGGVVGGSGSILVDHVTLSNQTTAGLFVNGDNSAENMYRALRCYVDDSAVTMQTGIHIQRPNPTVNPTNNFGDVGGHAFDDCAVTRAGGTLTTGWLFDSVRYNTFIGVMLSNCVSDGNIGNAYVFQNVKNIRAVANNWAEVTRVPPNYQSAWSSATAYTSGQSSKYNGVIYQAVNNVGPSVTNPATDTVNWVALSSSYAMQINGGADFLLGGWSLDGKAWGAVEFLPPVPSAAWAGGTTYQWGDLVTDNGSVWYMSNIGAMSSTTTAPHLNVTDWSAAGSVDSPEIFASRIPNGTAFKVTSGAGMQPTNLRQHGNQVSGCLEMSNDLLTFTNAQTSNGSLGAWSAFTVLTNGNGGQAQALGLFDANALATTYLRGDNGGLGVLNGSFSPIFKVLSTGQFQTFGTSNQLRLGPSSAVSTTLSATPTVARTVTIPDASGAVLLDSSTIPQSALRQSFDNPQDHGFVAWAGPLEMLGDRSSVLSVGAGVLHLIKVKLPDSGTISIANIVADVVTAGATLTVGQCFAAVYTSTGTLLGVTADQAVVWQTSGIKTMALVGGPFTQAGGPGAFVWVAFVYNGTTSPALVSYVNTGGFANQGLPAAAFKWASNTGTGAITTTLPASITPANNVAWTRNVWAALS